MPQSQLTKEDLAEIVDYSLTHPEWYVKNVLNSNPWQKQIEIVRSTFEYKYTAVKTCNAVGKSYIAARIALTYLMLHNPGIVVTTAPTWRQVTDILWREIGTAYKQAKYKLSKTEVTQAGLNLDTDWYAVGLSTKRPENFFGYHEDNILVIVDEAGGVEEMIFKGVDAITPNANARVLLVGNPTNPGGRFHEAFTNEALGYNCFTISAFDTPNFTANGISNVDKLLELFTPPEGVKQADWSKKVSESLKMPYPALIDPAVVYSRYHEWGVDSPHWESLILGEFPSQSEQALFPADLVEKAFNYKEGVYRNLHDENDPDNGKTYGEMTGWIVPEGDREYGLDMARFGMDRTVLTPRHGGFVEQQITWNKVDLVSSAERVINLIDPYKKTNIKIDDTGNGGGTTDALNRFQHQEGYEGRPAYQYVVHPYNFSRAPRDPAKFADITSEIYWNLSQWFKNKAIAFAYYDKELKSELLARRWSFTTNGKIKVESKEDYRKRTGGKSPDKSDSLALAFADSVSLNVVQQTDARRAEELPQKDEPVMRPITSGYGSVGAGNGGRPRF